MRTLDANTAVPLYEQLKIALKEMIDTELMRSGERLPSEAELCERYAVSRITVRRAVDEMVEAGLLERHRGKGTFVAQKGRKHILTPVNDVIGGFTDGYKGKKTDTHIVSKKEYPVNSFECEILGLKEPDRVFVLTRLMKVNDQPWMIDRATYPANRFPDFFKLVNEGVSTYKVLREEYDVVMHRTHKEFSLTYADQEQARLLGCASGAPLFKMFKVVYDDAGKPVHMSNTYFMADSVAFTIDSEIGKAPKLQSEYNM